MYLLFLTEIELDISWHFSEIIHMKCQFLAILSFSKNKNKWNKIIHKKTDVPL